MDPFTEEQRIALGLRPRTLRGWWFWLRYWSGIWRWWFYFLGGLLIALLVWARYFMVPPEL